MMNKMNREMVCLSILESGVMNVFALFCSSFVSACVFMYSALSGTLNLVCSVLQSVHVPGRACMMIPYMFVCAVQRSICHLFSVKC